MKLSNRQIGKIAREMCLAEDGYVKTRSYSEFRGGRRVQKYWLAFSGESVARAFCKRMEDLDISPIYKSYSHDAFGYVVDIVKEVEEEAKPKKKKEVLPEDFNLYRYGCKFAPKYKLNKKDVWASDRPDEIRIADEEVSTVIDEILFQMFIIADYTKDWNLGKKSFVFDQEVENLSSLCEMLKEVMEDKILKLDHHHGLWISDPLYGAKKNWKRKK